MVDGSSMYKTLEHGEKLLMRYVENGEGLERGDVIVVYVGDYEECSNIKGGYLIKRLIAIEGDKVKCMDGQISICYAGTNEYVPLEEPYAYYTRPNIYGYSLPPPRWKSQSQLRLPFRRGKLQVCQTTLSVGWRITHLPHIAPLNSVYPRGLARLYRLFAYL